MAIQTMNRTTNLTTKQGRHAEAMRLDGAARIVPMNRLSLRFLLRLSLRQLLH
ncbi:hypothetical protein [Burkholderia sp. MSMB2041]|uniref:hypothetical protein n=1 Tax=Burkholderia sp. MSMB2041 TaxID=1637839 RepID=UPI000A447A02|nr:hypothetical protein [Burkholderia sp. MSMB2041]